MSFDIVIQCRFSSSRLKGKIFYEFDNMSFLDFLLQNLKRAKEIRNIIIAVPFDKFTKIFQSIAKKNKVKIFYSKNISENNVLKRYYFCSKKFKIKNLIRITSDCPFINPIVVDEMVNNYKKKNLNFLTNNNPRYLPHGFDCEIIKYDLIQKMYTRAKSSYDKEHVTPWIYKNIFTKINNYKIINKDFSKIRLTLDYDTDYIKFKNNIQLLKDIATKKNYFKYLKKKLN
tara:strand:- start:39086 stop:39772 length:687 start_codon:yes stop_codon:yes gene_type:complete